MNPTASLVTLSRSIAPLTPTGWAEPMLVPWAMAFCGQAIMMKVPADAARGVDLDHHGGVAVAGGPLDPLLQIAGDERVDHPVELQHPDRGGGGGRLGVRAERRPQGQQQRRPHQGGDAPHGPHGPMILLYGPEREWFPSSCLP